MMKEIYEQPSVVQKTLGSVREEFAGESLDFASMKRLQIVSCGTSNYAAQVAKYWFERYANLSVEVDIASEYRYRHPTVEAGETVLFISQSGETADTLAALNYVRSKQARVLSIVNVAESSIARESDKVLRTQAGPEIGVASTKAFLTQLTTLASLAIQAGVERKFLDKKEEQHLKQVLDTLPPKLEGILGNESLIAEVAASLTDVKSALFIARGTLFPIAMEGALKLKEISYIHAEGYAAGELKHGPIALVDKETPVITLIQDDELAEKSVSNAQEVIARGGRIILFASEKTAHSIGGEAEHCILMPEVDPFLAPMIYVVPLQLLAYYVALLRGNDVDQPRNLAKSVTVE